MRQRPSNSTTECHRLHLLVLKCKNFIYTATRSEWISGRRCVSAEVMRTPSRRLACVTSRTRGPDEDGYVKMDMKLTSFRWSIIFIYRDHLEVSWNFIGTDSKAGLKKWDDLFRMPHWIPTGNGALWNTNKRYKRWMKIKKIKRKIRPNKNFLNPLSDILADYLDPFTPRPRVFWCGMKIVAAWDVPYVPWGGHEGFVNELAQWWGIGETFF